MPFPYIFTFYSYKGGVGRSMALMNVAYALVGRGRHVLIVDMDLEAPGVSGFLQRTGEFAPPQSAHLKDVLTLLDEALKVKADGGPLKERARNLPPLSHYIRSVAEERLDPLKPQLGKIGRLDVLGTDLEQNYNERLAQLGIRNLPRDRILIVSSLLHHYFKQQVFPFRPLGVEDFEPPIETPYDYILIDSRTGVTEIGGLCVGPLADRLVVLTGLNDQNVEGTLSFMREAGIHPRARTEKDEPWDDADTIADNPTLGPKPTILVASPVPAGEIMYKHQRLGYLQESLGIGPRVLSYHPQMALMESIFVRDYRGEYLAAEYMNLGTMVMAQVGDDPTRLSFESARLLNQKGRSSAIACALRLASDNPNMGIVVLAQLSSGLEPDGIQASQLLARLFATLSQSATTRLPALYSWGTVLSERAKTKERETADRFLEEAGRKYAEAIRLKPDYAEAHNNWGNALSERARNRGGADSEADALLAEASRKYADAIRFRPDHPQTLNNWGTALSERAKFKAGEDADRLFDEADSKFATAIRLRPDFPEALYNWGAALADRAKTKDGKEADRLFDEADRKCAEAIRLKPDSHEAYSSWGSALHERAKAKGGIKADRLFEEAGRKYAEASRLKPDFRPALINRALALSDQAKTKQGDQALHLRQQAAQKFLDVARLDVKQSNTPGAIQALQTAISLDPTITKSQLAADPLLNRPEFLSLCENPVTTP